MDISDGRINRADLITTSEAISDAYKRTVLKTGDLVMPLRGKIGDVAIIDDDLIGCNLTRGVALIAIRSDWHASFFKHFISSSVTRSRLENSTNGSALQEIPIATLRAFKIPVPPSKSEQEAIAAALSDVDALIGGLDQLIAKKRDIKKAAMQQLLTGRQRLPGFSGEWEVTTFGAVLTGFSSGATPYRAKSEYYKGDIPWITSGELNYNLVSETHEKITKEAVEQTNLKILPKGTFLMAITGLEAAGTRGSCGIVGVEAATNQSCMALFATDRLVTEYLFHYYVLRGDVLALQYCQGTKQQSYTASIVKRLPIHLPPTVEEQTAIATVLSDMDAELTALEQQREKTRDIKQGMMQELLTGRIRLVQPERQAAKAA